MAKEEKTLDPVDIYVGSRIRMRRLLMGLSQDNLAKLIGLTFQQVQKYEKGSNRVSVSRLIDIAKVLKIEFKFFLPETDIESPLSNEACVDKLEITLTDEHFRFIRLFAQIKDSDKDQVINILKTFVRK